MLINVLLIKRKTCHFPFTAVFWTGNSNDELICFDFETNLHLKVFIIYYDDENAAFFLFLCSHGNLVKVRLSCFRVLSCYQTNKWKSTFSLLVIVSNMSFSDICTTPTSLVASKLFKIPLFNFENVSTYYDIHIPPFAFLHCILSK